MPGGVLRRFSEQSLSAGSDPDHRTERDVSAKAATARLAQERVPGFIDAELAHNRVKSGLIDPVWRDLEAEALEVFKPSEALVRSGMSTMSLGQRLGNQVSSVAKQILGSPGRVEQGSVARGESAERGPMGLPENSYRNGLAAQQTKAVVDAWKKPAGWRRTEVELVISPTGEVESIRVLSSCRDQEARCAGRRGDHARSGQADAVLPRQAHHHHLGGRERLCRQRSYRRQRRRDRQWHRDGRRAGGFKFDETGLGRKNARGVRKYFSDPEYLVGGNIHTKVSLLSLREPPE